MYKRQVQEALAPEKDVDGITDGSMAGVFTNMPIGCLLYTSMVKGSAADQMAK